MSVQKYGVRTVNFTVLNSVVTNPEHTEYFFAKYGFDTAENEPF